jgi:serine/threonine protein kinase
MGIAHGLKHMHDRGIVHGHLASVRSSPIPRSQNFRRLTSSQQNILVGPDGTPRITGFGSSFIISRPDLWAGRDVVGFHRSSDPDLARLYRAGKPVAQLTKASDMYGFGILTWEVGTILHRNLRSQFAYYKADHISDLFGKEAIR